MKNEMTNTALELLNERYDLDLCVEYGDLKDIVEVNENLIDWKASRRNWRSCGTINEMFDSYSDSIAYEDVQTFKGESRFDLYVIEIENKTYCYKY